MNFKRVFGVALLVASLVFLISLRWLDVETKQLYEHDEGISLLSATGHQAAYAAQEVDDLKNQWVPARRWKAYVESVPGAIEHRRIAAELYGHDIHPPLYFWMLSHALALGPEQGVRVAYAVQIAWVLVAAVCLGLCLRLTSGLGGAWIGVTLFCLSPIVAGPYTVLRQYELLLALTCLTLLSLAALMRFGPGAGYWAAAAGLFACTLGGLLTHGQFLLLSVSMVLVCVLVALEWRVKAAVIATQALAVATFLWAQPGYLAALHRQQAQLQSASWDELQFRVAEVWRALTLLTGLPRGVGILLCAAIAGFALRSAWRARAVSTLSGQSARTVLIGVASLVLAMYLGQYILMKAPRHAMGGRYLYFAAPFLVLLLVLATEVRWYRFALMGYACVFGIQAAQLTHLKTQERLRADTDVVAHIERAGRVVLNNDARGVAAPVLPLVHDGAQIVVCNEKVSRQQFDDLVRRLQVGDVVLLRDGYRIDPSQYQWQRALLGERFRLRELGRGGYWLVEGAIEDGVTTAGLTP